MAAPTQPNRLEALMAATLTIVGTTHVEAVFRLMADSPELAARLIADYLRVRATQGIGRI